MRIGIDFGSTYSTVAIFKEDVDNAEAISMAEGDPTSIPSVVSYKSGATNAFNYGRAAKNQVGRNKVRIFEAFKMLIATQDEEMLRRRGYDDKFTPAFISARFLEYLIKGTIKRYGSKGSEEKIEELVICVPEVWGKDPHTQDGRPILADILRNQIDVKIDKARTVTEPEAASAFFAFNYERRTQKAFNGHLLLIDYGGGTLDITLTKVISDGEGKMEICYREGGGEGENHPTRGANGMIGCAGIAFMQNVVLRAIKNNVPDFDESEMDFSDPDFATAVVDLENELKSPRSSEIEDEFDMFGSYASMKKILSKPAKIFIEVDYDGDTVPITYQDLYASYAEVIEPVLNEQIQAINQKVQEHIGCDPCDPASGSNDDFKIALVGGFSSFYLVKKQLSDIYNLDSDNEVDPRTNHLEASSREQAIALGAALIAEHKVILQKTARFSFGIAKKESNKKTGETKYTNLYYAIKYHQVFKPGTPYFICYESGQRVSFASLKGNIDEFVIEYTDRPNYGRPIKCKREILDKLDRLPMYGVWHCGFSMDDNDTITFHIVPDETAVVGDDYKGLEIPLDSFQRMFELSEMKEVKV